MTTALPPLPPPIDAAEFDARLAQVSRLMAARDLSVLVLTAEANWRYLTGFTSQTWANLTRPRYLVVPCDRPPIVICPTSNVIAVRGTTNVADIRTWPAPQPSDDGLSLVAQAVRESSSGGKVGLELGPESRLGFPAGDFLRLIEMLRPLEVVDGEGVLRAARLAKSPAEIARMTWVSQAVSAGYQGLAAQLAPGDTERQAVGRLKVALVNTGVEAIPYCICVSGPGGYTDINTGPTSRVLAGGDIMIIDTAAAYDGYFCDFDREYAFGRPSDIVRRTYDAVWAATEAGIEAARPGARCADVWLAMANVLGADRVRQSNVGRMGHGVGLQMTEPPSIHPDDTTVLAPGMTLTIEPGLGFVTDCGSGDRKRVLVHEENIVVTGDRAVLMTRRAPKEMTVV